MSDGSPAVTFVVPCYKLGHLLAECVDSILAQTYEDFEVLIMDDCSPDDTPFVARSFTDPRVQHIRHERNVGHLHNYNVGITCARGRYVWLISADDRLRSPEVLRRYVDLLDSDPTLTFVFCSGMTLDVDGNEGAPTGLLSTQDTIFSSDSFTRICVRSNPVCTPGALARRSLYLRMGLFPTDLPYAGDWYTWGYFGMLGRVAYIADPLVNYRIHDLSYTSRYRREHVKVIVRDGITVRWRFTRELKSKKRTGAIKACYEAIAYYYAERLMDSRIGSPFGLTTHEFESSLVEHAPTRKEQRLVRGRTLELLADFLHDQHNSVESQFFYSSALRDKPASIRVWVKYLLGELGNRGLQARNMVSAVKRRMLDHVSRSYCV